MLENTIDLGIEIAYIHTKKTQYEQVSRETISYTVRMELNLERRHLKSLMPWT